MKQPVSPTSSSRFATPETELAMPAPASGGTLRFHHLEIFLARPAFGTAPARRDVLPARAGGDAILGPALRLVVDVAAGEATPFLQGTVGTQGGGHERKEKALSRMRDWCAPEDRQHPHP